FGIETIYTFQFKDNELFTECTEKEFVFPKYHLITLFSIVISGVRGMLVAKTTNPAYKKLILPPLNPEEAIKVLVKKGIYQDSSAK
ncbi:MAG: hypothetical protein J7L22_09770, partial [Candidatus Marinimicrobia bacterium]|nr:hypothetical protein [Candidatus Neomarinimicrobiota bacterium]